MRRSNQFLNKKKRIHVRAEKQRKNVSSPSQNCALAAFNARPLFRRKTLQQLQQLQHNDDAEESGVVVVVCSSISFAVVLACVTITSFFAIGAGTSTTIPPLKHKNETRRYTARHTNCASLLLWMELFIAASCKCVDPMYTRKAMSTAARKLPVRTVVQRNCNIL